MLPPMPEPRAPAAAAAPARAPPRSLRPAARALLLCACSVLVAVQLTQFFKKLTSPPVSTHTSIVLNASTPYPALTVCRWPSYRSSVLRKYNLVDVTKTSQWDQFPYDEVSLQDFWDEATYSAGEVLHSHALHELQENVRVEAHTFLVSGTCFTVLPHGAGAAAPAADAQPGYSVLLGHGRFAPPGDPTTGWTLFVHEHDQPFIEESGHSSGHQEKVFVEVGEELHIKVTVQEFQLVDRPQLRCNDTPGYSYVECLARCHWERLVREAGGCAAPWLPVRAPHCANADAHHRLLVGYLSQHCAAPCCACLRRCRSRELRPFVVKRRLVETTVTNHSFSQLYVFYADKVVTRVAEHAAYDWAEFLAEVGGSLGFLLGLSVLGAADALEQGARAVLPALRRAAAACRRRLRCGPTAPAAAPDAAPDAVPNAGPDAVLGAVLDAPTAVRRSRKDAVLQAILSYK